MKIGIDTETTGLDLFHGAKPYFVSTCDESGTNTYWRWEVDPETREPVVDPRDLKEIQEIIDEADELILQNTKFDYLALQTVFGGKLRWDWSRVRDTLLAGHLLASNQPHDLTTMVMVYLNVDIGPFDEHLKKVCLEARRTVKSKLPTWRIAEKGLPEMPSVRGDAWKMDAWIPDQAADELSFPEDHPWRNVLAEYGNSDSAVLIPLYDVQMERIRERKLEKIYEERLRILPVVSKVERYGVTLSGRRLKEQIRRYRKESKAAGERCSSIARRNGYDLELPKSGNNQSLLTFVFDVLKLPVWKKSEKTGKPSLDQSVVGWYLSSLGHGTDGHDFMESLSEKRKRDTAINYMEGYERYRIPLAGTKDWFLLHPSLNPTGTDTLRWSSSNPNEQNISKREGFNLRYCFGPAPGREWWSLDYQNLELRIPSFEAEEADLIYVFEHPDEPPYYGSYHLVVADLLFPDEFREYGSEFKDVFKSTKYKWVKGGNFAVIYGAQEETADAAYHVRGAYRRIRSRFPRIAALSDRQIRIANDRGYVETIPDRSVDPKRGYPISCSRSRWGRISPTIPLNYHVQSTAMWLTTKAMVRCQEYLDELNETAGRIDYGMVMQVHDELVFDFPLRGRRNMPKVRKLARLMAQGGDEIGVPTPVSIEYHPDDWSRSQEEPR